MPIWAPTSRVVTATFSQLVGDVLTPTDPDRVRARAMRDGDTPTDYVYDAGDEGAIEKVSTGVYRLEVDCLTHGRHRARFEGEWDDAGNTTYKTYEESWYVSKSGFPADEGS